eukprot:1067008-Amphidinium_carterae.1
MTRRDTRQQCTPAACQQKKRPANGSALYRHKQNQTHWDKHIFDAINISQLDATMNADYTEEDDIGKASETTITSTLGQQQGGTTTTRP